MLQYAVLHLFGYDVSMDDIKNFRVGSNQPNIFSLISNLQLTRFLYNIKSAARLLVTPRLATPLVLR